MNNSKRLSDEVCQNIREKLSLKIGPDEAPFALSIDEEELGPDDWAWRFLRMNKKYQLAYADLIKTSDESKISQYVHEEDLSNIHADLDGSCRRNFGLAC